MNFWIALVISFIIVVAIRKYAFRATNPAELIIDCIVVAFLTFLFWNCHGDSPTKDPASPAPASLVESPAAAPADSQVINPNSTATTSHPEGWLAILVDDGFTWYIPANPSKTTEWFDISNWNLKFRLKAPAIMEFKTRAGGTVIFKLDGKYRHLKKKDGTFSTQHWSDDEYTETFHNSTAVRFTPINGTIPLQIRVGRRSY
jgi:hypothetical protein